MFQMRVSCFTLFSLVISLAVLISGTCSSGDMTRGDWVKSVRRKVLPVSVLWSGARLGWLRNSKQLLRKPTSGRSSIFWKLSLVLGRKALKASEKMRIFAIPERSPSWNPHLPNFGSPKPHQTPLDRKTCCSSFRYLVPSKLSRLSPLRNFSPCFDVSLPAPILEIPFPEIRSFASRNCLRKKIRFTF